MCLGGGWWDDVCWADWCLLQKLYKIVCKFGGDEGIVGIIVAGVETGAGGGGRLCAKIMKL